MLQYFCRADEDDAAHEETKQYKMTKLLARLGTGATDERSRIMSKNARAWGCERRRVGGSSCEPLHGPDEMQLFNFFGDFFARNVIAAGITIAHMCICHKQGMTMANYEHISVPQTLQFLYV